MFNRTTTTKAMALILIIAAAARPVAAADTALPPDHADYKALQSVYAAQGEALKRKDVAAIIKFETDDYTHKLRTGRVINKQQSDALLRQTLQGLKAVTAVEIGFAEVKLTGNQYIVTAVQRITATFVDREGKEHQLVDTTRVRDVWPRGAEWKIRYAEDLAGVTTIDGRAVPSR